MSLTAELFSEDRGSSPEYTPSKTAVMAAVVNVQSYTNVHNTLTERHAPPGFDPGHTGWEPTPLTTELSEPG